jgi:GNAT superfamily N-acetyltransferase
MILHADRIPRAKIEVRDTLKESDPDDIERIVRSSGYFSPEEIQVARELAEERLQKGIASGYHFVFAELGGQVVSYACFGPIPCTQESYDLYWIASDETYRGKGVGTAALEAAEQAIEKLGGRRIYVETSSRDQYDSTRAFYDRRGYAIEATIKDFYAPEDSKVIYLKLV